IAPILIGVLVSMSLPLQMNFLAIAIPAVVAAVAIALISAARSHTAQLHHAHGITAAAR
ncbi:MAG: MFS transporter, partial [Brachymonas sp.]|nr:MFS transporter [Brachymonas sp.]